MKGSFLNNSLKTFLTSFVIIIVGIIISAIVARMLGPEGRGNYAIIIQSINILIALGQFGLVDVMLSQTQKKYNRFEALAGNSIIFIIVSSFTIVLGLWLSYYLLADSIFKNVNPQLLCLAFFMAPFNLIITFFIRIIQLSGNITLYNRVLLLRQFFWLLSIVLWIIFWDNTLEAVLFGLISAQFIAALYSVFIVRRYVATKKWIMDKYLFINSLKGGMKLAIGISSGLLGQQIGIFILNYYMDSQEVGWYAISLGLASMVFIISTSIRTVLQSWIGSADESIIKISKQTVVITRHVFLILLLISLIFVLFGENIIRIFYGAAFLPSYKPMLILLCFVLLRSIDQIISSYLTYIKHFWTLSFAAISGMLISVVLAIWLIQINGMIGAAVSTVCGQFVATLIVFYSFIRNTNNSIIDFIPEIHDYYFYKNQAKYLYNQVIH